MNCDFKFKSACMLLLALASISGAALAQVYPAYREGWEQGYREGREREYRREEHGHIHIEEAIYGFHEGRCDARGSLHEAAAGRRHLDILVNNNLCGDPYVGRVKQLFVRYRCGDGPSIGVSAREREVLSLRCR